MYGSSDLKSRFRVSDIDVECPVLGCRKVVERKKQKDSNLRSDQFRCEKCNIYISPSTFEYVNKEDNLLWKSPSDLALLQAIIASKAESNRFNRERSEDAVTWNVFRYFHRSDRMGELLNHFDDELDQTKVESVFWSYSDRNKAPWTELLEARIAFGEALTLDQAKTGVRVSEPDIVFITKEDVIFVECKFGSDNKTSGSTDDVERRINNPKQYIDGGNGWYKKVFRSDYASVVNDQKYELMRFWLLGSWIARKSRKRFRLVNLVREGKELEIENQFGKHISQTDEWSFHRWTWESLEALLKESTAETDTLLYNYMLQKTIGFQKVKRNNEATPIKAFFQGRES